METRTAETYKKACDEVLLSRSKDKSKAVRVQMINGSSLSFFKSFQKEKTVS